MESEVNVVAFDVDGTLYGKGAYVWRMMASGFPDLALAFAYNRARILYRQEQGTVSVSPENREGYRRRLALLMLRVLHIQPTEEHIRRIDARTQRQLYGTWERLYRHVRGRSGMSEAMGSLKEKGYRIAILSDFPLVGKLEALDAASFVDVVLCSEDTGYLKPDCHVFQELLKRLGCRPEQVLYVGDSYQKDVLGSRKMGMHSLLLTRKTGRIYPKAEYVVKSFKELVSLFD